MVRKRTRRYSSEDNDSDSDFAVDGAEEEPATKRYSLRQRKSMTFTSDYDYSLGDEEANENGEEEEEEIEEEGSDTEYKQSSEEDEDYDYDVQSESHVIEPYVQYDDDAANADPQSADGLIDFEDIIRADVVVNKNKIDYENVIHRTEIKVQECKRRGRKPKSNPGGAMEVVESEQKFNVNCVTVLRPEGETSNAVVNNGGLEAKSEVATTTQQPLPPPTTTNNNNNSSLQETSTPDPAPDCSRVVEQTTRNINEKEKNNINSASSNGIITSNVEKDCCNNVQNSIETNNKQTNEELNKCKLKTDLTEPKVEIEDDDDDDVILLEEKQVVIVLDD